jgi:serine/threonine protein phosphatase PrpC
MGLYQKYQTLKPGTLIRELKPNEEIILFTDGLTATKNQSGQTAFDLINNFLQTKNKDTLYNTLLKFICDTKATDDITILTL